MFDSLELKDTSVILNKKKLLSNISLSIKKSEKIAIIGSSGAGKTLLINLLCLGLKPTSGIVEINSKDFWFDNYYFNKKFRKFMHYVPQTPQLPPRQKVITAIHAGFISEWSIFKVIFSLIYPFRKDQVIEVLNDLKLSDKLLEFIENLSGGQKQAISLARLFVANPEIMIIDEPLNSVDPSRSDFLIRKIFKYSKLKNSTIICSLHQPLIAKQYFDRIVGVKNGKIFFDHDAKKITKKQINDLYN